ncbi:MAG: hypothetical protein ACJ8DI_11195 [Ktedonobacteraceae bacterium]
MWPFDQNNQQIYQQYANAWDQGTYGQLPEQEVQQNYRQFVQNALPGMVEQVHQQYYEQMPPQQRGGRFRVCSGVSCSRDSILSKQGYRTPIPIACPRERQHA